MKLPLLALALTLAFLSSLPAADSTRPAPGFYLGTLRVTKVHRLEGLSTTYTLRTQARVSEDGAIAIATTVPESPASASNVESALTRATPIVIDPVAAALDNPLILLSSVEPLELEKTTANYTIDAKYRAQLKAIGNVFHLRYANPPAGFVLTQSLIPGGAQTDVRPYDQFTMFSFTFTKRR